jgi:mRNA interferase MazF
MIHEGQVVLFRFPQTDRTGGKLRPALVLRKLPGPYDDWMICMISSQLSQCIAGFDEVISGSDPDYSSSGLKAASVARISRLAVVDKAILCGAIGEISAGRLSRIKKNLADWIAQKQR